MKKIVSVSLFFLCLTLFFGCGGNKLRATVDESGTYVIDLPYAQNDTKVTVKEEYLKHLPNIDYDLFMTSYENMLFYVKDGSALFEVTIDAEGYLRLAGEIIRDIDPPNVQIIDGEITSSGCGIDHEHHLFYEKISLEPVASEKR